MFANPWFLSLDVAMLGRITLNLYDFMIPSLITTITMQVHVEGDKLLPP